MLDFEAVVEFGLFVGGERRCLLALDEIPNSLARGLRRLEVDHFAGAQRSDELNELFVRSHGVSVAFLISKEREGVTAKYLATLKASLNAGKSNCFAVRPSVATSVVSSKPFHNALHSKLV